MTTQSLSFKPTINVYASCSVDAVMHQVDCLILKAATGQDKTSTPISGQHSAQNANACIEAVEYHFTTPGQKVRAKLCLHACMQLNVHYDDMLVLAVVSELLHNASLIHDDIQDKDETRRGYASVWKKFGVDIAICAGDLLLSTAYGILVNYSNPKLLPKLITTINRQTRSAIEGQSGDIAYKHNQKISTEEYAQIAEKKSGALLSLPIELALIASDHIEWLEIARKASSNLAVGYQIIDDLEDIEKDASDENAAQSTNIYFVLKDLGYSNSLHKAALMCNSHLDQAISHAQQLPNGSGSFLLSLTALLKNKLKILINIKTIQL